MTAKFEKAPCHGDGAKRTMKEAFLGYGVDKDFSRRNILNRLPGRTGCMHPS